MKHCTFYDFHFYLTNSIFHLHLLMSNLIILRLLSSCCKTTVLENFYPSNPKIYLIIVHCLKSVICSDPNSLCKHSHHLQINSQMILQISLGDLQFHQAGSFYNYIYICIQIIFHMIVHKYKMIQYSCIYILTFVYVIYRFECKSSCWA